MSVIDSIDKFSSGIKDKAFYYKEHIPSQKLKKVLSTCAKGIDPTEDSILLYYYSMFAGLRSLLFTSDGIFFQEPENRPLHCAYKNIDSVELKGKKIVINSALVINMEGCEKNTLVILVKMIQAIIDEMTAATIAKKVMPVIKETPKVKPVKVISNNNLEDEVVSLLKKLKSLADMGLISESELLEKRKVLLDRMISGAELSTPEMSSKKDNSKSSARDLDNQITFALNDDDNNSCVMKAEIKWGFSECDFSDEDIPVEFKTAKKLWESGHPEKLKKAYQLVSPLVSCTFYPGNICGDLSEILDIDDDIESDGVNVFDLDFSESILPSIRASTSFTVKYKGKFSKEKINEWQNENEALDSGVTFYWNFDNPDDYDIMLTNHDELIVVIDDIKKNTRNSKKDASELRDQNKKKQFKEKVSAMSTNNCYVMLEVLSKNKDELDYFLDSVKTEESPLPSELINNYGPGRITFDEDEEEANVPQLLLINQWENRSVRLPDIAQGPGSTFLENDDDETSSIYCARFTMYIKNLQDGCPISNYVFSASEEFPDLNFIASWAYLDANDIGSVGFIEVVAGEEVDAEVVYAASDPTQYVRLADIWLQCSVFV